MRTIYTITPSWLIKNKEDYLKGLKFLRGLGFSIKNDKILSTMPTPRKKALEIKKAFSDKGTDIILAQRGGYSSLKTLPFIDFKAIKQNPKLFAGFSDLSTLLNTIFERTGLITLHAPMVINFSDPSRFTVRSFQNALNGFPEKDLFKGAPVKIYKNGSAAGLLKGGNLVTLTSLIKTNWELDTKNAIVFFEDVDEEPHRVDRYLTQWILAGYFKGIKGLILGDFRGVKNEDVFRVLAEQIKVNFPVVHCPYIGHVKHKITLPVGARVRLDTRSRTLVII